MDQPDAVENTSRRRLLGVSAAAAATVWVAPTILSADAASAASAPPPAAGTLSGTITTCQHANDPGETFLVQATANPGGTVRSTTTDDAGDYTLAGLAAGTWDVLLHPNGPNNSGRPDQPLGTSTIVSNATTTLNADYEAFGC
jgi:hypothetical protein